MRLRLWDDARKCVRGGRSRTRRTGRGAGESTSAEILYHAELEVFARITLGVSARGDGVGERRMCQGVGKRLLPPVVPLHDPLEGGEMKKVCVRRARRKSVRGTFLRGLEGTLLGYQWRGQTGGYGTMYSYTMLGGHTYSCTEGMGSFALGGNQTTYVWALH